MDFISNQSTQIDAMLKELGLKSVEELFAAIPEVLRLKPPIEDDGLSEYEGLLLMEKLAAKNSFSQYDNYLGAGAYEHYVPALVNAICSKSEFLTAYTPYQAEASQGMLQAIFEFQSAICALTGLDAANASVYDGASACAEAVLMALRHHKNRKKILVAASIHPNYLGVIEQYLKGQECQLVQIPYDKNGLFDKEFFLNELDETVAAFLIQSPNFFGCFEDVKELFDLCHSKNCLTILCANPLSYGLFLSAKELAADIAVGDLQPFGISLQFGGPYAGYMCCTTELLRQLPGRIVGETVDTKGRRGFVLTLQAREQHIRREKATSNICTNQALAALASLIAMLWYGKTGLPKLALSCYQRAAYLKSELEKIDTISLLNYQPIFNEFTITFQQPLEKWMAAFKNKGIMPGVPIREGLLIAVTETKSLEQLNLYIQTAREVVNG